MLLPRSLYLLERQNRDAMSAARSLLTRRVLGRVLQVKQMYPDCWRWMLCSEHVEGFLSPAEANQLYLLSRDFTPGQQPVVVEIGSWKGKSSIMLAAGLLHKVQPRLFCIDPFGPSDDPQYQDIYARMVPSNSCDLEQVFRWNVRICGLDHIVTPLKGLSSEHAAKWTQPIDLLFVDGNHEYEAVLEDFTQWSRFVRLGGVVAFHDVGEYYEGPTRVVSEHLHAPRFGPVHRLEALAWAVKKEDSPAVASSGTTALYAHN